MLSFSKICLLLLLGNSNCSCFCFWAIITVLVSVWVSGTVAFFCHLSSLELASFAYIIAVHVGPVYIMLDTKLQPAQLLCIPRGSEQQRMGFQQADSGVCEAAGCSGSHCHEQAASCQWAEHCRQSKPSCQCSSLMEQCSPLSGWHKQTW